MSNNFQEFENAAPRLAGAASYNVFRHVIRHRLPSKVIASRPLPLSYITWHNSEQCTDEGKRELQLGDSLSMCQHIQHELMSKSDPEIFQTMPSNTSEDATTT